MASRPRWRFRHSVWLQLILALAMVAAAWSAFAARDGQKSATGPAPVEWAPVRRGDLGDRLLVGGDLKPTRETSIKCQVEDITDSDGTVIVSLIDNGTPVKKGDELCRLDSSQLEELARLEEITVVEVRSSHVQTLLALEVARIALHEYQDGLVAQQTKDYEVQIALARSDSEKLADRVRWSEKMAEKGYCSRGQLLTERQALDVARHQMRKAQGEFQVFQKLQVPKELMRLRGEIETAEKNHQVEVLRLRAQEDRLAHIRKQIEDCSVRAPHDGVAVHARRSWRSPPLAPGVRVYEGQELLKLPDPSRMEVEISVHETVGHLVKQGMRAVVRIASIADRLIPGKIVSIIPLPIQNDKEWDEHLRHYLARVRLDEVPSGILPTMSAEVEIALGHPLETLVIPVQAMSVFEGKPSCYVMAESGVERRAITTGRSTMDLLEVTGGLREGERVVTRFAGVDEVLLQ